MQTLWHTLEHTHAGTQLWYIAISAATKKRQAIEVPPVVPKGPDEMELYEQAKRYYELRKKIHWDWQQKDHLLDDLEEYRCVCLFVCACVRAICGALLGTTNDFCCRYHT